MHEVVLRVDRGLQVDRGQVTEKHFFMGEDEVNPRSLRTSAATAKSNPDE